MDKWYSKIVTNKHITIEDELFLQVAALPYRYHNNSYEILLITSNTTKRWIIPKGWPQKGKTLPQSAAAEAYEEAGVKGIISDLPIASYNYEKLKRKKNTSKKIHLDVFSLEVTQQLDNWPEKNQRYLQWFTPDEAALILQEKALVDIILDFFAELTSKQIK